MYRQRSDTGGSVCPACLGTGSVWIVLTEPDHKGRTGPTRRPCLCHAGGPVAERCGWPRHELEEQHRQYRTYPTKDDAERASGHRVADGTASTRTLAREIAGDWHVAPERDVTREEF